MEQIYQEITKYSKTLMFKEPFYGLFLISLNKELSKHIPTACVTPDNINVKLVVNPEYWVKQDEQTKLGILKHELLHIVFFHLNNFDRFPNKELYNVAADLEINQYIDNSMKGKTWEGLEITNSPFKELNLLPKQGTKYYYEILQKEIKDNPDGDLAKSMECDGDGSDGGGGIGDIHELWKAVEGLGEAERNLISKQIDYQLKEIVETLEKQNKGRGLIPSEMEDYINNLFEIKEPVIDWTSYLRRFNSMSTMTYTKKTRRKPNRRFNSGPALKIKQKKKTLVAIDTSGSVSQDDLYEFFNEIYHIYKTGTYIDVIECDAMIQRVYQYKGEREEIKVKGRGGTSFEPVMEYLVENRNKYANLIYLTDGACPSPSTKPIKPMLWVHCSTSNINEELPGLKVKINK
ncbi:Putative metallopeptidase domain containing protein [uncultured Caudovirales phage]|uniref:Metallopeptidase domain containing protein n=1 Tax=uncultured Caudovirales phage TaxID=2100421 RepID=A0A6J5LZG5_9CAUD|nr:Putative metallopeptidase domain containing protein [uncultured Caudovirales phage]